MNEKEDYIDPHPPGRTDPIGHVPDSNEVTPAIQFVEDEATQKARAMLAGTTADDLPEFVEALADTIREFSWPHEWEMGEVGIVPHTDTKGDEIIRIQLSKIKALRDYEHLWGYEMWFCNDEKDDLCVKLLVVEANAYGSLHSHETKKERFILLSGSIDLYLSSNGRILVSSLTLGQTFTLQTGKKHRLCNPSKTTTALLLEVSDYEDDAVEKFMPSGKGQPSFEPVQTDDDDCVPSD